MGPLDYILAIGALAAFGYICWMIYVGYKFATAFISLVATFFGVFPGNKAEKD